MGHGWQIDFTLLIFHLSASSLSLRRGRRKGEGAASLKLLAHVGNIVFVVLMDHHGQGVSTKATDKSISH